MAIEDFTNQLQALQEQLEEHGDPDLQLSPDVKRRYDQAIGRFITELEEARDMAANSRFGSGFRVGSWGSPYGGVCVGGFSSAQATAEFVHRNVVGADGFCTILDKYIEYLGEFKETVNACFSRMQAEDEGF